MDFLNSFAIAFIPILVAMDAIGVLPFYISFVKGEPLKQRKRLLKEAVITAAAVGIGFIFLGKAVFGFLGITIGDFQVAGGLILVLLSVNDLLFSRKKRQQPTGSLGVVPLGMPLIVGPAVLTTLIVLVDQTGIWPTLAAFASNLVITYATFRSSNLIVKRLGTGGTQAISKVANLLLAAIGVMTIRMGIMSFLGSMP